MAGTCPHSSTKVLSEAHVEKGISETAEAKVEAKSKARNPLEGIPRDQLMSEVEAFAKRTGLQQHTALLRKGALIAQNPDQAHAIDGAEKLSAYELNVLDREITHKWHLPARLFLTILTCCVGAAAHGWDQAGSNGAIIFFKEYYGLNNNTILDNILVGLIVSAPFLGSAILGCWLSDPINNYFGRRGVIFFAAQFTIWPALGSAICRTWQQQLACRLLIGIGMGSRASTAPVYAAENAPASIRGALVSSWQLWIAFSIMLGSAFELAVYNTGHNLNWRLMLAAPLIPSVPVVLLIYLCPESPRWYLKKGRYVDAWKSLIRLRHDPIQVARDIYFFSAQIEMESQLVGKTNCITRFIQLFTVPRIRRANLAALTVIIAQQLCGINIIAFYSTTIFVESNLSHFKALIGSFGFGLVNWTFSFPAFWIIDTFGRRSLLLFTFPQMFWSLLAAGFCTLIPIDSGSLRISLVCLFIYLFAAFYSPGEGPIAFTYAAEVFPLSHREIGMAFSAATCFFWAALLGTSFPFLLALLQTVGAFGLYAGFNLLSFVMIFLFVPETKQRTLEELDYVFAVPTRTFIRYQVTVVLPWWFKRYIFCQRNATKPPLYSIDEAAADLDDSSLHQSAGQRISSEKGTGPT